MHPLLDALPESERPRERLLRHGAGVLHDAELLAVLLGTGGRAHDALSSAHEMLARFGDLRRIASAGVGELSSVAGLGFVKALRIQAALALAARLGERPIARGEVLDHPGAVFDRLGQRLKALEREVFLALALDVKHRVLRELTLALGGSSSVEVFPRDVFSALVREGANAVIFIHNHPSGDPEPSEEDDLLTERLRAAGDLLGVRVLDHIVVAQGGYFSYREAEAIRERNSGQQKGVL